MLMVKLPLTMLCNVMVCDGRVESAQRVNRSDTEYWNGLHINQRWDDVHVSKLCLTPRFSVLACIFAVQELTLLLLGAAYHGAVPDLEWQQAFWQESPRLLRPASAKQLASIGWAVFARLRLQPPRVWVTSWLAALNKQCAPAANGTPALQRGDAMRAVTALALLGVPDLEDWCQKLKVPMPPAAMMNQLQARDPAHRQRKHAQHAVISLGSSEVVSAQQGTQSTTSDSVMLQGVLA